MNRPTAAFKSRMSLGSSGTITGTSGSRCLTVRSGFGGERSRRASRGERSLEHRLLERPRRETISGLLDLETGIAQRRCKCVLGNTAEREDEDIGGLGPFELGCERVAEVHLTR